MKLSVKLKNEIINFLKSLPNLDDIKSRRAFIYSVGLDPQLKAQIPFDDPPAQFVPFLVSILINYGRLEDGRYALEAVLEIAKNYIGQDKREYCDILIQKMYANTEEKKIERGEPQFGEIVHKMCNREYQMNDFLKFFKSRLNEGSRKPQFYFTHGRDGGCHESLIERLEKTYIKDYVEEHYGEEYADVYSKSVPWPFRGNLDTRKEDLRINFMKSFENVYVKNTGNLASTLSQLLSLQKRSMVIVKHNIHASQWDKQNEQLIVWYIKECWTKLNCLNNIPQFLIFLNVILRWPPLSRQKITNVKVQDELPFYTLFFSR